MDIRIVNREGNMYGVGGRTIITTGNMGNIVGVIDSEKRFEMISMYESREIAEEVKKEIIRKVREGIEKGKEGIVIEI